MKEDRNIEKDGALGIFTTVAFVLLFWALCWFKCYSPFTVQQNIKVIFPEIVGLDENADVYVDGVKVGCVSKINWLEKKAVIVSLRINNAKAIIRKGARFDILTNGLVGAKYVDITLPEANDTIPLDGSMLVMGEKPVRTELAVNKFVSLFNQVDVDQIKEDLDNDQKIFKRAADKFCLLANKTILVMDRALPLEDEVNRLSSRLRMTAKKLDRLLDVEDVSPELKKTVKLANETAQNMRIAIHELNQTLADKNMRQDFINAMNQFEESSENLESSMEMLSQLSKDQDLRNDTKQMLLDARIAMQKLYDVFNDPDFGSDFKATMQKTRAAVQDIDIAASN